MTAIGQGSKQSIQSQITAMGSNMVMIRPESNVQGGVRQDNANVQSLTEADITALEKQPEFINGVSPSVSAKSQAINGPYNWSTTVQGVSPAYLTIRNWPIASGIPFDAQDVKTAAKVCLVGQTIVTNLFPNGGEVLGSDIRFKRIPFKIIGILSKKGVNTFGQDQDDIILAPVTTVQKRITATTYYQNIFASAIDANSTDQAVDEVTRVLRASHKLQNNEADDFTVRSQTRAHCKSKISTLFKPIHLTPVFFYMIIRFKGISYIYEGL